MEKIESDWKWRFWKVEPIFSKYTNDDIAPLTHDEAGYACFCVYVHTFVLRIGNSSTLKRGFRSPKTDLFGNALQSG